MVARQVQTSDPAILDALATVRLGTSQFRRALDRVGDADFDGPSLLPGWSRRQLVAHVGYNARAIARLVTWAATGVETPMYASVQARNAEIEVGATLRPDALRSLAEHGAVDLDVRWRDLPADRWGESVRTAQGRVVPVSETLWMRTREVWLHAVDLDSGTRMGDLPTHVLDRVLTDVWGAWRQRDQLDGLSVRVTGPAGRELVPSEVAVSDLDAQVSGSLADVVAWATGRTRDAGDLTWSGISRPAPRWL